MNSIAKLKTDKALLDAMKASSPPKKASELLEQRVSFVFGSLSHKNKLTREQVQRMILALC